MLLSIKTQAIITRVTGWTTFVSASVVILFGTQEFFKEWESSSSRHPMESIEVFFFILFLITLGSAIFYTATTLFVSPWKKVYKIMLKSQETDADNLLN